MKPTQQIFKALLLGIESSVVPREYHLSARGTLATLQGLETAFAHQLEKLAKVDPKLDEYLKKFTPEEIANHLRYLQGVQEVSR